MKMTSDKEYRLSFDERARELVSEMSFKEKVKLIAGNCKIYESMGIGSYNSKPYGAGGCKRLEVPEMEFCDGPRGCVCGNSTCFPVTMARGATFDPELEERVGRAIGEEIRAHGGNFYGGVCINMPYNPGGGRSQETYGEDSVHIGKMGEALVKGVQNENVIACIEAMGFKPSVITGYSKVKGHNEFRCFDIKYCQSPNRIFNIRRMELCDARQAYRTHPPQSSCRSH